MILTEASFLPLLESLQAESPDIRLINLDAGEYQGLLDGGSPEEPASQAGWEDDFAILYTSGTTGFPKGAVLTQESILAVTHNMMTAFGHSHRDRFMLQLPLCFTGALIPLSMPIFHAGGTIFLEKDFVPARSLELIEEEKITVSCGVPTLWKMVSDEAGFDGCGLQLHAIGSLRWGACPDESAEGLPGERRSLYRGLRTDRRRGVQHVPAPGSGGRRRAGDTYRFSGMMFVR